MSKRLTPSYRCTFQSLAAGPMRALLVAAFAAVSLAAHAEYRCTDPSSQEDRRACALARQDSADPLRHFIQSTAPIYGLYFFDYVKAADFDRWEAARRDDAASSVAGRRDGAEKVASAR